MIKQRNILFGAVIILFLNNCNTGNEKIFLKRNNNRTSTIYLEYNNHKTDSLNFNDWYNNGIIKKFDKNKWICNFNDGGGSGVVFKSTFLFSVKDKKLIKNIYFNSYYKEKVLGDTTFKKNFIRKTDLIKNKNQLYLKRICLKDDVEFYSKNENLYYDQSSHIYYNRSYNYLGNDYKGIKIDSTEYIYYKDKWYEFDNKIGKLYSEL